MTRVPRVLAGFVALSLAFALSACSIDTVIWGADGAQVITTTEGLIDAAAAGEAASLICAGHEPELGEPADWAGLSAEEPERFSAGYWPDQAPLDPAWSINLSLPADRAASGVVFPGDVFYQQTDGGLCLIDVAWSTVL